MSFDQNQKKQYNPDIIFNNRKPSYFGKTDFKIKYTEFTRATGIRKFVNSIVVIGFFLIVEAVIVANYPPAKDFVSSFFSLSR